MPRSKQKSEAKRKDLLAQKRIEYIGKVFGYLTVTGIIGYGGNSAVICTVVCDCGNNKVLPLNNILTGNSVSCGCYSVKLLVQRSTKHGLDASPLNAVWYGIKRRCYNEKSPSYQGYGAKNIGMCDEWRYDFLCFYNWCISNGWKKGLQIDRFPDQRGNYSPDNCRIATQTVNANNKSNNVIITVYGESMTLAQASHKFNVDYNLLWRRIFNKKWKPEDAIETPWQKGAYVKKTAIK